MEDIVVHKEVTNNELNEPGTEDHIRKNSEKDGNLNVAEINRNIFKFCIVGKAKELRDELINVADYEKIPLNFNLPNISYELSKADNETKDEKKPNQLALSLQI